VVCVTTTGSTRRTGPRELTRLLGAWPTAGVPAYAALAARVRLLVLDGRLPVGVRLPPERELAGSLGVSRTTVSAAYDVLRDSGHAASRQGSGTWTSLPSSGAQVPTWAPEPAPEGVLDLAHAAPSAPPHLHGAYAAALEALPRHLPGTGYDYRGLASLRSRLAERFTERGLPTTTDQVLVTSGALQAVRLGLALAVGPGDRVVVEQPGYPNGLDVVTDLGARAVPVPVDPARGSWDVGALAAAARQTSARAAYLIPDFQNPSGALMPTAARREVARALERAVTVAVVDETLVELALDPLEMPAPFATFAGRQVPVVTVGSASKIIWGGLRVGWLRSDATTVARLAALRSRQDLASPVLEQLACLHLLDELDSVRQHRVSELRRSRDALVGLVRARLPDWSFRVPQGGQVLWCALPGGSSAALAAAAGDLGVRITPGSRFAADGTLESWVRLPYTRTPEELAVAVPLIARAWAMTGGRATGRPRLVDEPAADDEAYVV
jgi:DNA-binding transcriptional MocR family regulator